MNGDRDWLEIAVQNNMDWYDAESDAWGISYSRSATVWSSTHVMPPYHSNLLSCGPLPETILDQLDETLTGPWSVKDAHKQYDLTPWGFRTLFDAWWFVREPGGWGLPATNVHTVGSAAELERWVAAWGETPTGTTVFVPAILDNPQVSIVYTLEGDTMTAGLCANRSIGAVGITNAFGPREGIARCLAHVANTQVTAGLVGYDRTEDLEWLRPHGFRALGELRIWIKE